MLEEQLVDLASSEPVVLYESPLSSGTQPTTSKEVFSKENVSSVPSVTVRTILCPTFQIMCYFLG